MAGSTEIELEDDDYECMMDAEDPTDRYDAATWLRKRIGVVAARDLPAEPSEEDFRLGLRSGMILCNVLNKIKPGAVSKVINAPSAVFHTPDAAAKSAYFENVKNFLGAVDEMGIPPFDPSDLEQGGDFSQVVNTVLAMKAFSEATNGKFSWTSKPPARSFVRRSSAPSIASLSRTHSLSSVMSTDITDQFVDEDDPTDEGDSGPLYNIVCDLLENKDEQDIPVIVENILNKVKEEFEGRLGIHTTKDDKEKNSNSMDEKKEPIQKNIKEEDGTIDDDQATQKQEEDIAAKEQERMEREKERAEREKERAEREKERAEREKELEAQKEKERIEREKELEAQKEKESIEREKELEAQKEKARKQEEEAKAEQERIKKEKELLKQKERERKKEEARAAKEQARIKKEKELQAKRELKAQKEKERKEKKEQERLKRQKELLALKEKAKMEEMSAKELERINRERELLEEEDKIRQAEEELERIEKEREQERAKKKEEFKTKMDEYSKLNVDTTKRKELVDQQDNELEGFRSIISSAKTDIQSMQSNCQGEADNLGKYVGTLCQAAAGYKKVLEENRKLYNQVQDLKGSIRVYCRVRPFLRGQENRVTSVDYMDEETVAIIIPTKSGKEGRKASMFNKVFGPSSTQEEVFSDTQPLIRSVLDGFNVCIFACGQTGSGKTYTLTGPDDVTPETMGVGYKALNDLFLIMDERKNLTAYEISINMVEIYNDEIRDLLVEDGSNKILDVVNGAKKGINLPDANLVPVSSTDEVIHLMNLCQKNRAANDHSSRSHSFLTVHVFGKDLTAGTTTRGCMHLVDLAGNERLDTSDDEAAHIQKSLSALGDVLVALANKSSRVPYKSCKLTQLLQDALGAQAKILMFVHVHPDIDEAGETLNTFKFVERFSTLEGGAGKSSDVRELKEQICLLKAALAKKEAGDPQWQDLAMSSPRSGKDSAFGDAEDDDESASSKNKNSASKQPAKSASIKKAATGAVAASKLGKSSTAADTKKKKVGK
ncbi:kinesin-like protein KIN-14I [Rutidosis leptorrhynchoides]|uniref:kinesin-like protein KIN-14I n=1 Tax=Rutidosis leptorrhynchoides TaxID=125765 RepID=UPI003A9A56CB